MSTQGCQAPEALQSRCEGSPALSPPGVGTPVPSARANAASCLVGQDGGMAETPFSSGKWRCTASPALVLQWGTGVSGEGCPPVPHKGLSLRPGEHPPTLAPYLLLFPQSSPGAQASQEGSGCVVGLGLITRQDEWKAAKGF